jgi:PAS domain-containing protein
MRADLEQLLIASYRSVVGGDLVDCAGGALYGAPAVVLMHGIEADPVFCYANARAQRLWGYTWDEFVTLPSRLSAEPVAREERERLLARAREHGYIDDYCGVRIARDGARFRIEGVVLWNVVVDGIRHGQAAVFNRWDPLPAAS